MSALHRSISLIALASALTAGAAFAQETGEEGSEENAVRLETVTVRGFALQNQLSIMEKRNNDATADFLAADEINRQPDYNIADAFRRAPGVFTIFDEDEGRYVGIRGLNADYTIASLDGSLIATAERGNRRVNLEAIPSSAVKRLEVFKSRTANLEGNAIGGTINMVTRSAFDADGLYAVGSAGIGYTTDQDVPGEGYGRDSDNGPSYRGEFTISNTFANDTFGVVASGSYLQRRRDQQRFGGSFSGSTPANDFPNTSSVIYQGYPNTIERFGGFLKFEYQPSDDFFIDTLFSRYTQEDTELRLGQQINLRGAQTAVDSDTNAYAQGQAFIRFNDFFIDKPIFTAQSHMRWTPGEDHVIKASASYSEATFHEPSNQILFTTPNNLTELGGTFDFRDGAPVVTVNDSSFLLNGANYPFTSYIFYDQDNDDYVSEYSADYGFNTDRGDMGLGFDTGLQFRNNTRDFDEQRSTYTLASGNTLDASDFILGDTFRGPYNNYNQLILDGGAFLDYFRANRGLFNEAVSNTASDYRFSEDVTAAYGQAVYKADRFKILAGLRWEQTETSVERPRTEGGVASVVTRTSKYDNLLPSLTGYYDLSDNLKLRGSYFQAIGRPNPTDLAGSETVTIGGDGMPQLSRGNPDLEARKSDNLDVSLEYFFPENQGLFAVALFSKEIDNEIFRFQTEEMIDGVLTRVTQPRNVASASLQGFEVSYVQNNLGRFVDMLDGFGAQANYTWFDGKSDVVGADAEVLREIDQLLQQPKYVFNASIFYDRGPFETRVTYALASSYPTSVSSSATSYSDREDEEYYQLDWTARYDLTSRLQLTGEIRNITNETKANFQTSEWGNALRDYSSYGRTVFVGVAFKY